MASLRPDRAEVVFDDFKAPFDADQAAPAGLDDAVRYMFRNFHGSDAEVGAGFSGLIHWLDTEGASLLNQSANASNVNAFVIDDLRTEDVSRLGLPDDGRDLANLSQLSGSAAGVDRSRLRG